MKDDSTLAKLQEEANRRLKLAKEALLNDDKDTARNNIEWVNLSSSIIEKYSKKPDVRKLSIIIGLATIMLIGAGLVIKIPKTNVSIDLTTSSVSMKLKKDWTISNRFVPTYLSISNVREIYGAGAGVNIKNGEPFGVGFTGKGISVSELGFPVDTEISILIKDTIQNLIIKNAALNTDVQVGKARMDINDGQEERLFDYQIPEIITVKTFSSVAVPVIVSISDTSSWSFRGMSVSDINFLEESPVGSGKFTSSIISGKIKILETEQEYALDEADWLHLAAIENRKMQLSKSGKVLKLHLEGQVSEVRAGSELFEKTLNPSVAEYMYYAKSFAFFWSCVVFIWSMIWSVKNSVFSK